MPSSRFTARTRRGRPRFMQESALALRIGDFLMGQHLDGDGAVETRIGGAKHLPLPSRTDGSFDVVRAELTARRRTWSGSHLRDTVAAGPPLHAATRDRLREHERAVMRLDLLPPLRVQ